MNDASGMEVFYTAQHLVQEIGQPLVIQLHLYDLAEVGVHQLHHQIPDKDPTEAFKHSEKQNTVKSLTRLKERYVATYTSWNSSNDF